MTETQIKTLYGMDHYVKGNEPFLSWWRAGLYLKFNHGLQTHVMVETYMHSIDLDQLRVGDTLRIRIDRVTTREVSWFEKIARIWRKK